MASWRTWPGRPRASPSAPSTPCRPWRADVPVPFRAIDTATRAAWDRGRPEAGNGFASACYAPFSSLYLSTGGDVLACCQNTTHVLGNVADQSLVDIWHGPRTRALRDALAAYDLGSGCDFCALAAHEGRPETAYAREYELAVDGPEPAWPVRLELALSNTCNLECVMCNGDFSSRIRSRREGRAPLPEVYGERFFDELTTFLPHLREVRLLGGEPFLARESLRVLELLVEGGHRPVVQVTTNGTQWTPRVEAVLEALPVHVAVSLDGVRKETVEAIRVGADHGELLANLARFRDHTRRHGTSLSLTFCLMRHNWRELAEFCLLGDELDAAVYVNTVTEPDHALRSLPAAELDEVVAGLDEADRALGGRLGRNRGPWEAELARVRGWAEAAHGEGGGAPVSVEPHAAPLPGSHDDYGTHALPIAVRRAAAGPEPTPDRARALAEEGMRDQRFGVLTCDGADVVTRAEGLDDFYRMRAADLVGRPYEEGARRASEVHGDRISVVANEAVEGGTLRRLVYRDAEGRALYVQAFAQPLRDGGRVVGSVTSASWSRTVPDWAPAAPTLR